ncbi:MAG TPA: glycosyltransferase [Alphaproteobacteria bacterium]|nr:glycosyltransferase [Alphaproteobacteria bacterium]
MSKPKVTYALLCYKQEKFVRDAVRSALAQDLTPLDIILSDDCSPDGTFTILEEEAKAYRGPNSVRLNRNEVNLGIEHNNKAVQMAEGDLIIIAHGDDIALPQRARKLTEAWQAHGVSLLSSNARIVDAALKPQGLLSARDSHRIELSEILELKWKKTMLGASFAIDREVFTRFGWLDRRVIPVGTDHILPFRAAMLRGMYYLAEPLMYWRQHATNTGDLVGDKTGSSLVFRETYTGYRIMTTLALLQDLGQMQVNPGDEVRIAKLRHALGLRLATQLKSWITLRNGLYLEGKRPTWIEKSELAARLIRSDLRVWPDRAESEEPNSE